MLLYIFIIETLLQILLFISIQSVSNLFMLRVYNVIYVKSF